MICLAECEWILVTWFPENEQMLLKYVSEENRISVQIPRQVRRPKQNTFIPASYDHQMIVSSNCWMTDLIRPIRRDNNWRWRTWIDDTTVNNPWMLEYVFPRSSYRGTTNLIDLSKLGRAG
jgi:hypothetical protein